MRCQTLFLLLATAQFTTACAQSVSYQPRARVIAASKAQLIAAATAVATEQKWKILAVDSVAGVLTALSPEEDSAGVATRQRWSFVVTDGEVRARLVFEANFDGSDDGPWVHSDTVCTGYLYLREDEQLDKVAKQARGIRVARR